MTSRVVFYIATDADDGRYLREAELSAASVREHLGLPTILFTNVPGGKLEFAVTHQLPASDVEPWYLKSAGWFNYAIDQLRDYDQLLYLDTDTHVCRDCLDMFDLLDRFDMAIGHSASRDVNFSACDAPAAFTTPQIGVNVFNNSPRMRNFWFDWMRMFDDYANIYGDNDEAPLRDAMWDNQQGITWATLPPEYCLRFDFGCWVYGWVRILHGRDGGISTDKKSLTRVAEAINCRFGMRLWRHGIIE